MNYTNKLGVESDVISAPSSEATVVALNTLEVLVSMSNKVSRLEAIADAIQGPTPSNVAISAKQEPQSLLAKLNSVRDSAAVLDDRLSTVVSRLQSAVG